VKATVVSTARSLGRSTSLSEAGFGFLLNAPAVLLITALMLYPIVASFWGSLHFQQLRFGSAPQFVGWKNYLDILKQDDFWDALRVSAVFAGATLAMTTILGTGAALVLNEQFPGRGLVRALVLVPWAIPPVVNGLLWQWIFDGKVGIFNQLLVDVGAIDSYQSWLANTDPTIVLAALVFAHVWKTLPFSIIVLLAALQAIPADLHDAALVDRAGLLPRFRHVVLPWLMPALVVVLIVETLTAFQAFDLIYVLTGGGPGTTTTTLAWLTYLTAFDRLDLGHGNAYGYIIAMIQLMLAALYILTLRSGKGVAQ
jgi:multiple sugar transport system permease protein